MISEEKKAEIVAYLTAEGELNQGHFEVADDDGIYGVIVHSDGRMDIFEPHPMPTPKAFPEPVSEIENGAFTTVAGMLEWAADRMVDVYDEDDRTDFVLAFRREVERLRDHMDGLPLSEISGSDKGLSAFDVAKLNGFAGTCLEWLLTLTGPSGASEPRPATETVRVSDDEIDTLVQGIVEAGKTALGPDGYVALLEELADEEDPAGWIDAEALQLCHLAQRGHISRADVEEFGVDEAIRRGKAKDAAEFERISAQVAALPNRGHVGDVAFECTPIGSTVSIDVLRSVALIAFATGVGAGGGAEVSEEGRDLAVAQILEDVLNRKAAA